MNSIKKIIKNIAFFFLICIFTLSAFFSCYRIYTIFFADKRKKPIDNVLENKPPSINLAQEFEFIEYIPQSDDTLYDIRRKFLAYHLDYKQFSSGKIMKIPSMAGNYYKPQEQDTIAKISKDFNIPPDVLIQVNNLYEDDADSICSEIFIPNPYITDNYFDLHTLDFSRRFIWPIEGKIENKDSFGWQKVQDKFIFQKEFIIQPENNNAPVRAVFPGIIYDTGIDIVRGKYVEILHDKEYITLYSNLSEVLVFKDDVVPQGYIIARIDNNGTENKPYLRWGLFRFNLALNMLNVIREEDHHDFQFDDVNKYIYKTVEDNKIKFIRIIGYFGEGFKVNIPESINGFPVKEIWHNAFSDMGLIKVIIPEGVTYIGSSFNNNNLVSLKIPGTIEIIDKAAFAHNKLKRIMLSEGLKTIGKEAFYNNRLTNITIPSSVTNIKSYAFSHNKLTVVKIPDITKIEDSVFLDNNLRRITIPESVTSIGPSAFEDNKLRRIIIPPNVSRIENRAFGYNKLTNITIPPNSVIEIEPNSFSYNKLRSVELPDCVRIIHGNAFGNNMNLKKITIGADVDLIKNTINHDFVGNITYGVFDHNFDSFYSFIAKKQSGTYVYDKKTGWKKEEK
jgi:hypothetical protein